MPHRDPDPLSGGPVSGGVRGCERGPLSGAH